MLAVSLRHVSDLGGQLAGRRDDERSRVVGFSVRQAFQHWQQEGCGLPGPRLRAGDEVTSSAEDDRDGALLDRRRMGVAGAIDGSNKFRA